MPDLVGGGVADHLLRAEAVDEDQQVAHGIAYAVVAASMVAIVLLSVGVFVFDAVESVTS